MARYCFCPEVHCCCCLPWWAKTLNKWLVLFGYKIFFLLQSASYIYMKYQKWKTSFSAICHDNRKNPPERTTLQMLNKYPIKAIVLRQHLHHGCILLHLVMHMPTYINKCHNLSTQTNMGLTEPNTCNGIYFYTERIDRTSLAVNPYHLSSYCVSTSAFQHCFSHTNHIKEQKTRRQGANQVCSH